MNLTITFPPQLGSRYQDLWRLCGAPARLWSWEVALHVNQPTFVLMYPAHWAAGADLRVGCFDIGQAMHKTQTTHSVTNVVRLGTGLQLQLNAMDDADAGDKIQDD
ncbi:hypothetical protein AXG93_829s1050 [Marchantia polymorpha subsp. ruderalis]|uniref:Uncharacterized protein n=1 Tax=Marchantia polymorpha subsp. ruderalis TaxID=1480154 RepID=A0A176W214_MARPO|nr:hypothetical protein AXG93_829s1050 [Marchantia polymorpha subsp. ruderalis]